MEKNVNALGNLRMIEITEAAIKKAKKDRKKAAKLFKGMHIESAGVGSSKRYSYATKELVTTLIKVSGLPSTAVAEALRIPTATVCSWVAHSNNGRLNLENAVAFKKTLPERKTSTHTQERDVTIAKQAKTMMKNRGIEA